MFDLPRPSHYVRHGPTSYRVSLEHPACHFSEVGHALTIPTCRQMDVRAMGVARRRTSAESPIASMLGMAHCLARTMTSPRQSTTATPLTIPMAACQLVIEATTPITR